MYAVADGHCNTVVAAQSAGTQAAWHACQAKETEADNNVPLMCCNACKKHIRDIPACGMQHACTQLCVGAIQALCFRMLCIPYIKLVHLHRGLSSARDAVVVHAPMHALPAHNTALATFSMM
jgi:hypothetical protein